jgi:hypothetical protein
VVSPSVKQQFVKATSRKNDSTNCSAYPTPAWPEAAAPPISTNSVTITITNGTRRRWPIANVIAAIVFATGHPHWSLFAEERNRNQATTMLQGAITQDHNGWPSQAPDQKSKIASTTNQPAKGASSAHIKGTCTCNLSSPRGIGDTPPSYKTTSVWYLYTTCGPLVTKGEQTHWR